MRYARYGSAVRLLIVSVLGPWFLEGYLLTMLVLALPEEELGIPTGEMESMSWLCELATSLLAVPSLCVRHGEQTPRVLEM